MSDLRDWLRKHNLEQYAGTFEANDIDLDILPDLSERDLGQLGVSLGNRRRFLKALASNADRAAPNTSAPEPAPPSEAERRQVTVLFADMVGSTELSGKIDPEQLGEVIRCYQNAVAGAIGRYGGFVAKFMGDGVLAYFGFPHAFEDAAERAARAAIAVVKESGGIPLSEQANVQTRIGIATGLVVVGEIIGTGTAQERTIIGETPNLAARLQALAAPNTILVSEATQNLLGGLFDLEHSGEHVLKGFARPVPAWRVLGEAPVESRFAASRAGGNLPMIGRAHEMGLLMERWRLAQQGEGQIVTLIGEAGIGKSRSIEALHETLAGQPHARINLQCSAYHTDSALYPVLQYVGRAAHFGPTDTPGERIEKLGALFAQGAPMGGKALALLAELFSLPCAAGQLASQTPAQRKSATLSLMVDHFIGMGARDPLLIVLEDAHWADATTLDMMVRLADGMAGIRVLSMVTARPEFSPPWFGRPHATSLTLGRLARQECTQLVAGVAATHGLSAETVAAIVAKTDGIPLFIEELTKTVLESSGESAAVPATLKDSLTARLDRLGEAREVAQIAAVIGRQFSFPLLEAVASREAQQLETMLSRLVDAEIVFPEERGPARSFSFKHALVRDAAYESLLLSRRREWHGLVARAIERDFADAVANEPDLLAYHFSEAGLWAPACDYRMRAGDQAVSRSAYPEALAHFSRGLKLAEALQTDDRLQRQLDFLLKLGSASVVLHGLQSAEAEAAYMRANEIGEILADGPKQFQAKWGLWINANLRRRTSLARDRARELVALAKTSDDGDLLLEAHHCRWSTAFFQGDVTATLQECRTGVELYDIDRHRHLGHAFGGHDPGVCAHMQLGNSLQLAGERHHADDSFHHAIALAERLEHPNSLGHALHNGGICCQLGGDRDVTFTTAKRAVEVAEKYGLMPWRAGSIVLMGWATATGSSVSDAEKLIEAEIDNATAVGPLPQYYLGLAAEVLLAASRPADALAYLDRAIAGIDEPGIGFYLPEIFRLRGACLLALNRANKEEARTAFETALDIANRQGALVLARRAAASLSGLEH